MRQSLSFLSVYKEEMKTQGCQATEPLWTAVLIATEHGWSVEAISEGQKPVLRPLGYFICQEVFLCLIFTGVLGANLFSILPKTTSLSSIQVKI